MAINFLAALVEEQNGTREGRKLRGPYLAQIHLLHELIKRGDPSADEIGNAVKINIIYLLMIFPLFITLTKICNAF